MRLSKNRKFSISREYPLTFTASFGSMIWASAALLSSVGFNFSFSVSSANSLIRNVL